LHSAAEALEALGITDQPLASIAKREEWIYVQGQEDEQIVLDKFSPVLHLVQMVRDEAHRFAVTFHRSRRDTSRLRSELVRIHGVGEKTAAKLLQNFGSLERVRAASEEALAAVVGVKSARRVREGLQEEHAGASVEEASVK
jgi:excinuclease ABC subunit C